MNPFTFKTPIGLRHSVSQPDLATGEMQASGSKHRLFGRKRGLSNASVQEAEEGASEQLSGDAKHSVSSQ